MSSDWLFSRVSRSNKRRALLWPSPTVVFSLCPPEWVSTSSSVYQLARATPEGSEPSAFCSFSTTVKNVGPPFPGRLLPHRSTDGSSGVSSIDHQPGCRTLMAKNRLDKRRIGSSMFMAMIMDQKRKWKLAQLTCQVKIYRYGCGGNSLQILFWLMTWSSKRITFNSSLSDPI